MHKIGKPLGSPAFLRLLSLTFCVSKLFVRIILSYLLFFLKSDLIPSPRRVDLRTLDQILYFSQFFTDEFNKLKASSRSDDLCYHQLLLSFWLCLASHHLPPTYFGWPTTLLCLMDSKFSNRHTSVVFQNFKSRFF